jgi:hypothetical protein
MHASTKLRIIRWSKYVSAALAVLAWVAVIDTLTASQKGFYEEAPYCMLATMAIFTTLTGIYKGLEYWGRQGLSDTKT